MEQQIQTLGQIRRYDPTHTTVLRNAFVKDATSRFRHLRVAVRAGVDQNDCFGLREVTLFQVDPPAYRAFAFPRSADKVSAFMEWIERQIELGILEVGTIQQTGRAVESAWLNKYIFSSYKRGVLRARQEMRAAGYDVPPIEQTGGIEISLSTPFHMDRLGLLYTRVFNELKGITDAMSQQISRVLTQGIADGDNPLLLAKKIVAVIDGKGAGDLGVVDSLGRYIPAQRRAEMLARTEIIRAHHHATVQEYMNWRVEGVVIKAEWMTAGDNKVCEQCAALEGNVYTLEQILPLIPRHPMCRCVALPWKQEWVTGELTGRL